jgi:hypothetical protein
MINLRPLIEQRIKDEVIAFSEVAGAANLENIIAGRISSPGCYIFKERSQPQGGDLIGATMQRVVLRYAVIIIVKNVRDARGADAADESDSLQESVRTALLGWQPCPEADPMEYADGALVSFANGFFIWRDSFQTYQFIRS